ncbi:hypothetical protein J2Y41_000894 [Arthrobacter sp. 1088]|nr:hypothetical protein [Arthrobacter sp. 1088]
MRSPVKFLAIILITILAWMSSGCDIHGLPLAHKSMKLFSVICNLLDLSGHW